VAHQVNLVNTTGVTLDYWDGGAAANKNNGVVDGGTGTWQSSAGNSNWTNVTGAVNGPWANGEFAIFAAAPGTVTVDNSLGQVVASGMQFAVGGYTLSGAPLTLVETAAGSGATVVRVGDGTAAGTGMTAIIASVLQGSTQLVKEDLGTLVLSEANTYSGGTAIDGGTVQVAADSNLGAATGPLSFNGGTLATTASFTSGRATTLDSGGGTFDVAPSTTLTMNGAIDGTGALGKSNAGTLVLAADNTYTGGTTISAGTLQLGTGGTTGSILGDVADSGTLAFDRSDTVSFAGVISGSGNLAQIGPGTTTLTGANSYSGATNVDAGSLQAGASNTFSPNSAVTVAGGGTLDLNGFGQTVSGVTNAGLVSLGTDTAPGTVLTTTSYTGAGGTIAMNTFLGGDDSPSDKLVVNGGSATGNSLLRITNAGGPGAETVANGIAVVQAINGGTTAPGAFQLATATDVEVGDFDYRLFHGGVDGSNPGDWFLRSDFVVPPTPTPTPPTPTPTPPANPFPPQPPPNPLPPGVYPIIGPRLSAYGVVQPIARELGLTELGTLHQRIGDTLTTAYPEGEGWALSAWGRFFGETIDNRYQAFADPRASGHQVGFQTGLDLWRGSLIPGHRDVAGVYFAYGNSNVDVTGLVTNPAATAYVLQHTGTLSLNSYSGGGYWTHYGPGGWYFDAVLQGTGYGGNAMAQSANLPVTTKLATGGSGFLASLEGGYPVPLQFGTNFILEPQAQIVWQHVSFDPANDGIGTIALGSTSGTTERFGARAQWTILGGNGAVWQPYARANLWHGGGANAATSFAPSAIAVPLVEQATWLEFAGGVAYKLNPRLSFYAQAGYQFAVAPGNISRDGFSGDLGLRITW
jgi:outer membrane autotransporter protein